MLDFSKNYFELFGLPVDFIVDSAQLAARYRELQRVVHPDRFAKATEQERRLSLQKATMVNEAFQVLRDPLARARYLLALHGIDMDADASTTRDSGFLMEQIELREELEQARDQSDPLGAIGAMIGRIDQGMQRFIAQVAVQLETPTAQHLEEARETVRKMQFLSRLRSEAEGVEAALEDAL